MYKSYAPEINKVNRSQYGRSLDLKQDIVEYKCNNCYIATSGNCFKECIKNLTAKDLMDEFLAFIRNE